MTAAKRVEQAIVLDALAELPDAQRRALVLAFYEALPCGAVAEAMSTSVSDVRTSLHHGVRAVLSSIRTATGHR